MLRNLYRLLVPSSAHTIYHHRARARVINYWHHGRQRATSVPPDHLRRKNEENRSRIARGGCRMWPPLIFAKNAKLAQASLPNGNCCKQLRVLSNATTCALVFFFELFSRDRSTG
jgi:hypothetical protein